MPDMFAEGGENVSFVGEIPVHVHSHPGHLFSEQAPENSLSNLPASAVEQECEGNRTG